MLIYWDITSMECKWYFKEDRMTPSTKQIQFHISNMLTIYYMCVSQQLLRIYDTGILQVFSINWHISRLINLYFVRENAGKRLRHMERNISFVNQWSNCNAILQWLFDDVDYSSFRIRKQPKQSTRSRLPSLSSKNIPIKCLCLTQGKGTHVRHAKECKAIHQWIPFETVCGRKHRLFTIYILWLRICF